MLLCVVALLGGALAFGQDNFPKVSPAHAGYKAYVMLRARGLVPGLNHRRDTGPTAGEIASYLIHGVDDLDAILDSELKRMRRANLVVGNYRDDVALFSKGLFDDFRLAINSVRLEIRALGRAPDKLLASVEATRPVAAKIAGLLAGHLPTSGFRDVPKSHWASSAVQELKDAGILSGYPDGAFKG